MREFSGLKGNRPFRGKVVGLNLICIPFTFLILRLLTMFSQGLSNIGTRPTVASLEEHTVASHRGWGRWLALRSDQSHRLRPTNLKDLVGGWVGGCQVFL